MKTRRIILAAAVLALFAVPALASIDVMPIGTKLDGFSMKDPAGAAHSYKTLKGEKGTIVIFLSAQCPVVAAYNDRINEIADAYAAKGITMVGIYSNYTEDLAWVTRHSSENYKFTVLIDENNVFADRLGASFTPEIFYFNSDDVLDYHGAIDNDRSGSNITRPFLKTALNEKLSGKAISEQSTKAFGCSIKRVKAEG
ncbi:MAG: redoxin domain-containing protein [Aridibacter famidurans]|nr:redoxin domain-containing protein [Aridibacter famidurans]